MKNIRMQTVKNESELPDVGVSIQLIVSDNKIESVIIGECEEAITITRGSQYSDDLKILKPQAQKFKTVFVVKGRLLGLSDYESEPFDEEYKATSHLCSLIDKHGDMEGLSVHSQEVGYYEGSI